MRIMRDWLYNKVSLSMILVYGGSFVMHGYLNGTHYAPRGASGSKRSDVCDTHTHTP